MNRLLTVAILFALAMCANAASFRKLKLRCLVIGQKKKVHFNLPVVKGACQAKCASHKRAECVWWQKGHPGELLQATQTRIAKNCKITGPRGQVKFDLGVSRQTCRKLCENHPKATCMFNARVNLQTQ